MKKPLILVLCAAVFAVTSCKKNLDEDTIIIDPPYNPCLITKTTLKSAAGQSVETMTYNDLNLVSLIKSSYGFQYSFTYSKQEIVSKLSEDGVTNPIITTQLLDELGRIKSESDIFGNKTEYSYNPSGNLSEIKELSSTSPTIVKLNYTNGNLTTIVDGNRVITITYGKEVANPTLMITGEIDGYPEVLNHPLKRFYGLPSINLFTKIAYSDTDVYQTFTYQKDTRGNVTQIVAASVPANPENAFEYTAEYTCK